VTGENTLPVLKATHIKAVRPQRPAPGKQQYLIALGPAQAVRFRLYDGHAQSALGGKPATLGPSRRTAESMMRITGLRFVFARPMLLADHHGIPDVE
jgi:hypothetical protein